ncbi:heavy-metal-associated domain-containing protein [Pontibacter qinzhouensis]|uniref:Heavy-metal-associated domain-containing protein n=1 Tax=Pontibacter qinzhouensis TaxID=2603253 RepID=A0A5C8J983_9BACT|nr:heavy-metal-associated domain-containing protein [Pontibacter qinzhouensis]TXK33841.1 heavy-metal-associated domain-containing protein [Pontibacter qinzhouensis]
MKTYKFKTTINCGSCVRAITPHFNKLEGVTEWKVDTDNPDKVLEVKTETLDAQTIQNTVQKAWFKAEAIA